MNGVADRKVKKTGLIVLVSLFLVLTFSLNRVGAQTPPAGQELAWVNTNSLSGDMGQVSIDPIMIQSNYENSSYYANTVEVISISLYVDGEYAAARSYDNTTIQAKQVTNLPGISVSYAEGSHAVKIVVNYWLNSSNLNLIVNGKPYCTMTRMSWTSPSTGVTVTSAVQAASSWLIDLFAGTGVIALAGLALALLSGKGRRSVRRYGWRRLLR